MESTNQFLECPEMQSNEKDGGELLFMKAADETVVLAESKHSSVASTAKSSHLQ